MIFYRRVSIALLFALSSLSFANQPEQTYQADWHSLDKRETPQWWSDAKFGIFVHWGLYSVPAYAPVDQVEGVYEKYAEHYYNRLLEDNAFFTRYHQEKYGKDFGYGDFTAEFTAAHFDPKQWADLFKRAGARYVVLTSKHHDGYTLWPSQHSPQWNSVDTGPRRDIVGDLSHAVRAAGLRMGLYYSLLEWNKPLYRNDINRWAEDHMLPQMQDLVTRYKPEILFADGEWDYTSQELKSEQFLAWLYNDSPVKGTVVVNDRWGAETRSKHGGYYTTEYDLIGDELNTSPIQHAWEESRGIGTSYGYNQFERLEHYSTAKELIHLLIDKVSNGGNLLLNVGPRANGLIPVIMEERLLQMGEWLEVNGEAIYGTRPWRHHPRGSGKDTVFYTEKGSTLYVICTEWPQTPLVVDSITNVGGVQLVGSDVQVEFQLSNAGLQITPPVINPANAPAQHAWVFRVDKVSY